jgi:hypothetical protein
MNQNGHETGEKQLLRGSKILMIEKEVSNGEEKGYHNVAALVSFM